MELTTQTILSLPPSLPLSLSLSLSLSFAVFLLYHTEGELSRETGKQASRVTDCSTSGQSTCRKLRRSWLTWVPFSHGNSPLHYPPAFLFFISHFFKDVSKLPWLNFIIFPYPPHIERSRYFTTKMAVLHMKSSQARTYLTPLMCASLQQYLADK